MKNMLFKYLLLGGVIYVGYKFFFAPTKQPPIQTKESDPLDSEDSDFVEYEEIE